MQDHPQSLQTWFACGFLFLAKDFNILVFLQSGKMNFYVSAGWAQLLHALQCIFFFPLTWIGSLGMGAPWVGWSPTGHRLTKPPWAKQPQKQLQWDLHECPKSCWFWLFSLRANKVSAPSTGQGWHKSKLLPCCSAGVWQHLMLSSEFVLVQVGPTADFFPRHRFQSKEEVSVSRKQIKPQQLAKMFSSLIS